ncbi:hypothetical protein ACFE04_016073 [Oxalis oulophora]
MGRKKGHVVDDDEYSINTEVSEEPTQDDAIVITGKKKAKKGKLKPKGKFEDQDQDDDDKLKNGDNDDDEEDAPEIVFGGKKKKKKSAKSKKSGSSSVFSSSAFGLLDEDNDAGGGGDDDDDEKSEVVDEKDGEEDEPVIEFTGKKKKSAKSSKKSGNAFSAALLDDEDDDDVASVSESKGDSDTVMDDDDSVIAFSGKKKSSKKKKSNAPAAVNDDAEFVTEAVEPEQPKKSEEIAETSKNKKKKKKSGRTPQEEEDLDQLLAELGELNIQPSKPSQQEEKVELQPAPAPLAEASGEKEGEEEVAESAAAKKKKKKKEKEKEKKAAAAGLKEEKEEETKVEPKKNDPKGKAAPDKKVSKKVREMQEALERRKEAEERKKREEEEKLRKEEEERARLEEIERQAEEARRRKKEKEKEKLLKKKMEGKLLTAKQKEEARRREAMRNQILANAEIPLPSDNTESAATKRPIYKTKKSKAKENGTASVKVEENKEAEERATEHPEAVVEVGPTEAEHVEVVESVHVEEVANDEEEDDEEWDAKSWDDININGAFDDEDSNSQPVVKKEIKHSEPTAQTAGPSASIKPQVEKPIEVENKKSQTQVDVTDNSRKPTKSKASSSAPKKGEEDLRSPICCIMGHVDTGKTKLLDCIRGTNVQEGEAGGITQQIGATYFPAANIRDRTKELKADATLKVPGLLVIDTPGHESFTNLRSRGSGLCDIAILVVDIMHGLEPQTIESLNLLKMRNTEFIVALNKVDRLYGWKASRNAPIVKTMKNQTKDVQNEFNMRLTQIVTQFKEQGINTELYYKNKEMGETFSIVPTSAISGEGIPDLLLWLVQWTQKTMVEKLTFIDEVQCTVLEVKVIEGHGTTIDVVLVNGVLHEGDQIVVCGMQGPIVTTIRALLTPHPMKELRVKGTYLHHKEIKAAQGIKITAQGLEHAIAGTGLYVVGPDDDLEDVKEEAMEDMKSVMSRIDRSGEGIGTPICIPQKDFIDIGRISSIENNHKPVEQAKKGQKVAIKIVGSNPEEQQKMFGRHFEMEDQLVSHITRRSIDILKTHHREDLSMDEWKLVVKLKSLFKIP